MAPVSDVKSLGKIGDDYVPAFGFRVSRHARKKHSLNAISDFFRNSEIPKVGDTLILDALEEINEWKRYTQQEMDDIEIVYETGDICKKINSSGTTITTDHKSRRRNTQHLTKENASSVYKPPKKLWVMSGLYQLLKNSKKSKFHFSLPEGEGLRRLNSQEDFKLPWNIYAPTVSNEREILKWSHNLKRNIWLVDNPFKKIKHHYNHCNCVDSCDYNCLNTSSQIECTQNNCIFGNEDCGNRKFTNFQNDLNSHKRYATGYEVVKTDSKGYGLVAIRPYSKGALILEYTGEVITLKDVEKRLDTIYKDSENYYFLGLQNKYVIDSGTRGSVARFVNHSCEPNCEMQKWYVDNEPHIGLFAKKNIEVNEELSYDYNFQWFENAIPQECHCGSDHCRGVIGKTSGQNHNAAADAKPNPVKSGNSKPHAAAGRSGSSSSSRKATPVAKTLENSPNSASNDVKIRVKIENEQDLDMDIPITQLVASKSVEYELPGKQKAKKTAKEVVQDDQQPPAVETAVAENNPVENGIGEEADVNTAKDSKTTDAEKIVPDNEPKMQELDSDAVPQDVDEDDEIEEEGEEEEEDDDDDDDDDELYYEAEQESSDDLFEDSDDQYDEMDLEINQPKRKTRTTRARKNAKATRPRKNARAAAPRKKARTTAPRKKRTRRTLKYTPSPSPVPAAVQEKDEKEPAAARVKTPKKAVEKEAEQEKALPATPTETQPHPSPPPASQVESQVEAQSAQPEVPTQPVQESIEISAESPTFPIIVTKVISSSKKEQHGNHSSTNAGDSSPEFTIISEKNSSAPNLKSNDVTANNNSTPKRSVMSPSSLSSSSSKPKKTTFPSTFSMNKSDSRMGFSPKMDKPVKKTFPQSIPQTAVFKSPTIPKASPRPEGNLNAASITTVKQSNTINNEVLQSPLPLHPSPHHQQTFSQWNNQPQRSQQPQQQQQQPLFSPTLPPPHQSHYFQSSYFQNRLGRTQQQQQQQPQQQPLPQQMASPILQQRELSQQLTQQITQQIVQQQMTQSLPQQKQQMISIPIQQQQQPQQIHQQYQSHQPQSYFPSRPPAPPSTSSGAYDNYIIRPPGQQLQQQPQHQQHQQLHPYKPQGHQTSTGGTVVDRDDGYNDRQLPSKRRKRI